MIKTIIFDMDGVLYRGNTAIKGAAETITSLRKRGIRLFFLTNAGNRSRKSRAEKARRVGLDVRDEEVYTTSHAAAHYIANRKKGATVFCLGEPGTEDELRHAGLKVVQTEHPEFVLVCLDRFADYKKMSTAFRGIINGAEFIATNEDSTYPVEDGLLPGAGALVNFLKFSTGKKPIVIGKPNTYIFDMIMKESGSKKSEMLIVGDRPESDILLGHNAGIKTCLVLTGVAKREDAEKLKGKEKPDYILESVADVPTLLG
jgi:4-nitrophenyl phosphatase